MRKFLLVLSFFILSVGTVCGYEQTDDFKQGFYWRKFPVPMRIVESNDASISRLSALSKEAIEQWESATDFDIWEISTSKDVFSVIRWSDDLEGETGYTGGSTLGVAVRHYRGPYFERVEIILNKNIPDLTQNKNNLLLNTIRHELGHTVGLGHTLEYGVMQSLIVEDRFHFSEVDSDEGELVPSGLALDDIQGMKELIEETLYRQENGLVSTGGCVQQIGLGHNAGSASSSFSFLISFLIGFIILLVPRKY